MIDLLQNCRCALVRTNPWFPQGWVIFPESTNVGASRTRLEAAGVTIGGFDHRRGAFVGCIIDPLRVSEIAPAVLGETEAWY